MNRKQRHCILQMGLAYDAAVGAQTNDINTTGRPGLCAVYLLLYVLEY